MNAKQRRLRMLEQQMNSRRGPTWREYRAAEDRLMEDAMARIRAVLADPLSDDPLPPQSDEVLRDEAIVRAWDEARGYQRPDPEEAMARVWQKIEKLGRTMEESMAFEAAEDT